jgi:hypothetical protein
LAELRRELREFIDANFVELDGEFECIHQNAESHLMEMTCPPVNEFGLWPYKCCIGRCNDCPGMPVRAGENYREKPGDDQTDLHRVMVTYNQHEIRHSCRIHGGFVNKKEKGGLKVGDCPSCAALEEHQRPTENPTKTNDPVKKVAPIAIFNEEMEAFLQNTYRQHLWLVKALGKNHVKTWRDPWNILKGNHQWDVSIIRDYTDRIQCNYNNETQSGGMGGNVRNVGSEGFYYVYRNPATNDIEEHWHSYLSDFKQQDARTSFANTDKFILMMKAKGLLHEGSTLWIQSDGCAKQYKSGTNMWLCWHLSRKYHINIDWFITCAGHGKSVVDPLAGTDKRWIFGGYAHSIDSAKFDESHKWISEAHKACAWCKHPDRPLGDSQHATRWIKSRDYEVTNWDKKQIPLELTKWNAVGFEKGTKNGSSEMFHFRYQAGNLTKNECAVRRIPCACHACMEKLDLPWDPKKTTAEQPCFAAPDANCYFEPMMQGLNKWHIITLQQTEGQEQVDEINEVLQSALDYKVTLQEPWIEVGQFGIVDCDCDDAKDSALLVEWTTLPY